MYPPMNFNIQRDLDNPIGQRLMTMMQRGGERARIKHLCDLQYPGDDEIAKFKSQWNEVLECMRPFLKASKTPTLRKPISEHTQRLRPEKKNREAKTQGLKQLTTRYKPLPATSDGDNPKPAKAAPTPRVKAAAPAPPKNDAAAPVLADPKVKPHAKGDKGGKGKGKGNGKGRDRTRPLFQQRLQRKSRKVHVDSILVVGLHVLSEEIVSAVIQKIFLEQIVWQAAGRACVTRFFTENAQREKIAANPPSFPLSICQTQHMTLQSVCPIR